MDNTDTLLRLTLILIPEAIKRWARAHNEWKCIINPNKSIYHLVCWQIMSIKLNPDFNSKDESYYIRLRDLIIERYDILPMEYDLIMQAIIDSRINELR